MSALILATRNKHKVAEIRSILGSDFSYYSLNDLPNAPEVIEDSDSFAGNAQKKALELAHWILQTSQTNGIRLEGFDSKELISVLADDSGLEVDALNGAPGVISARFAAMDSGSPGNSPDSANNAKLLRLLNEIPMGQRTARFRCVLALASIPSQLQSSGTDKTTQDSSQIHSEIFEGSCEGSIGAVLSGHGGFGYDPLFIPDGFTQAFAELGEPIKNTISHRSMALSKLRRHLCPEG